MTSPSASTQAGFSLIEVMVAVLVLSLAFLSFGALAARSLSSNNSAMSRSVATMAMYSIMDVLRADRSGAIGGAYNRDIAANACPTGTSLALKQLNSWCTQQLADRALGGSVATTQAHIGCQATGVCTITMTWDDTSPVPGADAATPNRQTVSTTGML